ncbi:hypothetical protein GCM10020358_25270 [Amorphoplanes nipponensis]|uniref:Uncharacterized protein n=1 Tax=Actinoplanes nipponensis TaxID=135950 RepID=A0A919JQ17_9ACTN|nr:hypothetical protein [Actinoplanes nipponensis]GIE53365.1 hypothetical protein Ani05nite_68990 [Actinoplanes nipponensis]
MSTTAARLVALPFALAAFGLRVLDTFWVTPLTWRIGAWPPALAAWVVTLAASVGLPLGGYLLVTRRARRRGATWRIEPGGPGGPACFAAPPAPRWTGPWAVVMGWLAGAGLVTERVPGGDRMRFATFDRALPISVVAVGAVVLLVAVLVVSDRPRLTLDREAVTLRRYLSRSRVPWDDLLPGGPPLPARRDPEHLDLYRLTVGVTAPVRLPAGRLQVDSAYLAHTIRYYAEHPERRESIGTAQGQAALRSSFAG